MELTIGGTITAVDEDAKNADYRWEIQRAVVPGVAYANGLRRLLTERGSGPLDDVVCPERVELREGAQIECTVTQNGRSTLQVLELTNLDGGFRLIA